jgi:O-antigen/teichoic acid export membrane protein
MALASCEDEMPPSIRGFFTRNRNSPGDAALATVTRQGAWVLIGLVSAASLGFGFWAVAARLFASDAVGIAASLVSLSSFGAAFAILGLDAGLVRFAPRVRYPRKLIRTVLLVTGLLAGAVGLVLPLLLLTAVHRLQVDVLLPLLGLSLALTVCTVWSWVMNGAFLAAGKAQIASTALLGHGLLKLLILVSIVSAGVVGLFAAYTIPLLAVVLVTFLLLPRVWPVENPGGTSHSLREVASLSVGNWISNFGYSVPNLSGPALILIFFDAPTAAFFFIALQLADILNYASDSMARSLFAHGSREDRLMGSLASRVRTRILLILVPLVAVGIVAAPFIGSLVGAATYRGHALFLQLFLLATIPRGLYQVWFARFNVERRPMSLALCGGTFGALTLLTFVLGLILRVGADWLPAAWIVGGIGALVVAWHLVGRTSALPHPSPAVR